MFRFETAGESHGECLLATIAGLPAGIPIDLARIDRELWRRQQGYGRGGRMKIETDRAEIVAGVRHGQTIGAPIGIVIRNQDWKNWTESMPVEDFAGSAEKYKSVSRPRPGHADLAGAIKYNFTDARYILERASARETTARVAVGAMAKALLRPFGIEILSHVVSVGDCKLGREAAWPEIEALSRRDDVLLGCVDSAAEAHMKEAVDVAYRTGDTVGGVFEVVVKGAPVGLGSHATWDTRLDGKLAQAIVSMQAVKGVEIGFAEQGAASYGSAVQDTIHYRKEERSFYRGANRAGGIEGGMTNGEEIRIRGMLKPISTLRRPLESVDLPTREPAKAAYERSDVCVVPAAGVIGEAMTAIVLAGAFLEKFGGDSLIETQRNFEGFREQVARFLEMIYKIVKYGDPVLEREGQNVTNFNTPELDAFIADMFETMYKAKGVGLAAPQVGVSQKLTVIDCGRGEEEEPAPLVLINPEIIYKEGKQVGEEGCLSIPGFREDVKRAKVATVRAQDASGGYFEITGEDLLARAMQHEIDHLHGNSSSVI